MNAVKLLHSCFNVILAANCPVCGESTPEYPLIICQKCKSALAEDKAPPAAASICIPKILSCHAYGGAVTSCIKQFKYHRKKQMIYAFKERVQKICTKNINILKSVDLIIPVPIHPAKQRIRQFNQSEIVAKMLSEIVHLPVSMGNLIKTKNTPPQMGLTRKGRINNLKNSFSVSGPSSVSGKNVILIDDVMTTGATLDTCQVELAKAGVKSVIGFTLARTV